MHFKQSQFLTVYISYVNCTSVRENERAKENSKTMVLSHYLIINFFYTTLDSAALENTGENMKVWKMEGEMSVFWVCRAVLIHYSTQLSWICKLKEVGSLDVFVTDYRDLTDNREFYFYITNILSIHIVFFLQRQRITSNWIRNYLRTTAELWSAD